MSELAASSAFLALHEVSQEYPSARGPVAALADVSLAFGRARIVGIFGNNGAGKTTLTRLAAGLLEPTRGRVTLGGAAPRPARIGLAGADERSFYARLSALENLRFFGRLHGLSAREATARARVLARRLRLEALLERPFQALSAGEKQRVNLVRALLHDPELLILDEALRLSDPATVLAVRELLRERAREHGTLILYTGQEFQGLEQDCDEIVVLDEGRARLAGPAREVLARWAAPAWHVRFADAAAYEAARARFPLLQPAQDEDTALWPATLPGAAPEALLELARDPAAGLRLLEWRPELSVREILLELARGTRAPADLACGAPSRAEHAPVPARRALSSLALLAAFVRRDRLIEVSFRFELALRLGLVAVWCWMFWFVSRIVDAHDTRLTGRPFGFLFCGLAALQLSQTCLLRMGQRLREEQLAGTLEPLFATGVAPWRLLLSSLVWPLATLFAALASFAFLAERAGALSFAQADPLALALFLGLGCGVLAELGLVSAAFVLGFQRGDPLAAVFNLASLVLAGAYFPREVLPGWMQQLSAWLPQTQLVDGLRAAAFTGAGLEDPRCREALGVLALECAVGALLAAFALRLAHARARRRGSLGQA